jgi:uncharacterized protein
MLHLFRYGIALALCLGLVWRFVSKDSTEYAAFKVLTDTADRQRRYRVWIVKIFLFFTGTTLLLLALDRRLDSLTTLPVEFHSLYAWLQALVPKRQMVNRGFLAGFGLDVVGSIVGGIFLGKALARRKQASGAPVAGDVEPLMPRNGAETVWATLLSLNAGLSEELFFRLLLPLLIANLFGSAVFAFSVAVILFGVAHLYQGVSGVIATTFLGLVLTGLYLWTGNLWIAVGAHALLDLFGLVVRPNLARMVRAKEKDVPVDSLS